MKRTLALVLLLSLPAAASAEAIMAGIGLPGGSLPSSVRKFSFKELHKKVKKSQPVAAEKDEPAVAPTGTMVIEHSVRMPVAEEDPSLATEKENQSVDYYKKTFVEYEDFKPLVKDLPNGVSADDVAADLAQLRASSTGGGPTTDDLKGFLRELVAHTGKFKKADGSLDTDKLRATLLDFDIELNSRVSRAVTDLQLQIDESARLNRTNLAGK